MNDWQGMMPIAPWGELLQLAPGIPRVDGQWVDIGAKLLIVWLLVGLVGYARARMARWCGDPTPELARQLTLSPVRHQSMIGTWLMPLLLLHLTQGRFALGSGVPTALDPARKTNLSRLLVALARPGASVLIGIAALGLIAVLVIQVGLQTSDTAFAVLQCVSFIALVKGLLELTPFPPFEGAEIVRFLLPFERAKRAWDVFGGWVAFIVLIAFLGLLLAITFPEMRWLLPHVQPVYEPIAARIASAIDFVGQLGEEVYLQAKARAK